MQSALFEVAGAGFGKMPTVAPTTTCLARVSDSTLNPDLQATVVPVCRASAFVVATMA